MSYIRHEKAGPSAERSSSLTATVGPGAAARGTRECESRPPCPGVLEPDVLEIASEQLDRVEVGRVGREPDEPARPIRRPASPASRRGERIYPEAAKACGP